MPTTTTAKRVQMCQDVLLARVLIRGGNLLEAHHAALDIAIREGLFYLDGYSSLAKSYKKFDWTHSLRTYAC